MGYVRGWRGRIGLIFPAPGGAPDFEYHERVPEGVGIFIARLPFEACTVDGLSIMGTFVEDAAALVAQAKVDLILFACTTGSLVKGPGYDKQLIARIEKRTGIPALTTSTAVVDAMNALKMKKIAVATPYSDEVNEAETRFLEGSGFKVSAIRGLGNTDPLAMGKVRHERMYRLSRRFTPMTWTASLSAVPASACSTSSTSSRRIYRSPWSRATRHLSGRHSGSWGSAKSSRGWAVV